MLADADRTALQNALRDDETVRLAYLFGSHAQGRASEASDVDVAVLTESDDNELRQLVALKTTLEEVVDRTVDVTLVPVRGTDPRLLNQVLQYGDLLYTRDEKTRVDFETSARSKYLDMKPHIDQYHRRVKERLLQ
jgi:predicted nucleotidyltransferase